MDEVTLTAEFAADTTREDGDDVVYSGRLFKAGDYPEVAFSLTPSEIHETIRTFLRPRPMDFEHMPSVFETEDGVEDLTGKFGLIDEISADPSGEWILAQARKPKWLHELMPETQVSATFRRSDKALIGAAWTATPRVDGAELVAAFARTAHTTATGQMHLQGIHDRTVAAGAVCSPGKANMASRKESGAIQQLHDIASGNGAKCEGTNGSGTAMPMPLFAEPETGLRPTEPRRRISMKNITDLFRKLAAANDIELEGTDEELLSQFSEPAASRITELEQALTAERDRLAKLEEKSSANFAATEAERRGFAAVSFANTQVETHRITPGGMDTLSALHARVAEGDTTANFADGETSTTALLEEFVRGLPDLSLFATPQLQVGDTVLNVSAVTTDPDKTYSQEEIDKLMALTPVGRDMLAARKA